MDGGGRMLEFKQHELERLASELEGRAIWMDEVTYVPPSTAGLLFLISQMERAALGERAWHQYEGREIVENLKRNAACQGYDPARSAHSLDDYAAQSVQLTQMNFELQQNIRPAIEILRHATSVVDPVFVLPLVDYDINFHDHNRLLAEIGRCLGPGLQAILSGQCHPGFGNFGNDSLTYLHCLTDGQYNALRHGKIRTPRGHQQPSVDVSCFLSYAGEDKAIADKVYLDLQARGIRVWFADDNLRGGSKLHEQIEEAISEHDNFIVILSKFSLKNQWVKAEIKWARENQRKFFPIRLMPLDQVPDNLLETFVYDFDSPYPENWMFERLVRDLRREELKCA